MIDEARALVYQSKETINLFNPNYICDESQNNPAAHRTCRKNQQTIKLKAYKAEALQA